jgi:DNA-binding beta-propeller fold protein YncE
MIRATLAAGAVLLAASIPASAQIAVSANDGKVKLVNGAAQVVKEPVPDTISIIDLSASPPKVLSELQVPTSVVGPPMSVAITPDEQIALVTSAMKIDPADPSKLVADDRLTVIDLNRKAPSLVGRIKSAVSKKASTETPAAESGAKVIETLKAGAGAAGVSINKAGNLALVANRNEGTVSIFTIEGKTVKAAGKVELGNDKSGPSHVVFLPDGKSALVTRDNDHKISELKIDGAKVEYTKRDFSAGLRPYGIDVTGNGDVAVVANIGPGTGDNDTVSVIDLKAQPTRVVNTVTVGPTPEGIKISPDGKFVAVAVMDGSNKAPNSPFFKENGRLIVYGRTGTSLSKVAEAPVGKWCQGIVWARNSKSLAVQCMVEEEILVFSFSGITAKGLKKTGTLKVKGGPAAIRTAEK